MPVSDRQAIRPVTDATTLSERAATLVEQDILSGHLPPGARLALNKALAERKLLPLEITRTILPANPLGKKIVVRSRHLVNWSLSGEDRKKIDRAGTYLAEFSAVSFEDYRSASAKPPVKTARK